MFKLLLAIMIISITSVQTTKHSKHIKNLTCPFTKPNGKPCIRSVKFLKKIDDGKVSKHIRPDIFRSNMTETQRNQEQFCCYEKECLEKCTLYLRTFDEDKWEKLIEGAGALARLNRDFFRNYRSSSWGNIENMKQFVEESMIEVAHFYLNKNNIPVASQLIGRLPDKL